MFSFIGGLKIGWRIVTLVFSVGLFFALLYGVKNINWPGTIHMWIDHNLFGFLTKSDADMFDSLKRALKPDEQKQISEVQPYRQAEIAQSIFTELSQDTRLFDDLLHSGIFSKWTWYWIVLYGVITFTLLTLLSFFGVILFSAGSLLMLFSLNCVLAIVFLFGAMVVGRQLAEMSKRSVDMIVVKHQDLIAEMLREALYAEE